MYRSLLKQNNLKHMFFIYFNFRLELRRYTLNSSNLWAKFRISKFEEETHICKNLKYLGFKELSLCHKLWFSNPYFFSTQCLRPYIFQAKYTDKSNNLSLKYQRFTPSGFKDLGI